MLILARDLELGRHREQPGRLVVKRDQNQAQLRRGPHASDGRLP